jgi:hypothetical protein
MLCDLDVFNENLRDTWRQHTGMTGHLLMKAVVAIFAGACGPRGVCCVRDQVGLARTRRRAFLFLPTSDPVCLQSIWHIIGGQFKFHALRWGVIPHISIAIMRNIIVGVAEGFL